MATVTLYCQDAKSLKLGPGVGSTPAVNVPGQLIVFFEHYASFDEKDYPDWRAWLAGAPHIEVLEGDEVPNTTTEFVCPDCGKGFATKKALNGHRMSHKP